MSLMSHPRIKPFCRKCTDNLNIDDKVLYKLLLEYAEVMQSQVLSWVVQNGLFSKDLKSRAHSQAKQYRKQRRQKHALSPCMTITGSISVGLRTRATDLGCLS